MKQVIEVENLGYNITITDDSFDKFVKNIVDYTNGQKILYVISKKIYKIYNKELNLPKSNIIIINDGEKQKNSKNYAKIIEKAYNCDLTRNDFIVSIGGGVVGDLAGFAASTYMRGINYIQVPTTLLAMVDSSVGGKTALNTRYAKNIIGTFFQPKAVFINLSFLKTLDKKQYRSGLGEVLKYAFIETSCEHSESLYLFEFLTLSFEKIQEKEPRTMLRLIEHCLNLKIAVVSKDEKDTSLRKILNFGHTLAHAIETLTKYKKFTHGEAVIYGIYFILDWAYKQKLITYSYHRLALDLLNKYNYSELNLRKFDKEALIHLMTLDKKATMGKITFIVPCDKKMVKEAYLTIEDVRNMFN